MCSILCPGDFFLERLTSLGQLLTTAISTFARARRLRAALSCCVRPRSVCSHKIVCDPRNTLYHMRWQYIFLGHGGNVQIPRMLSCKQNSHKITFSRLIILYKSHKERPEEFPLKTWTSQLATCEFRIRIFRKKHNDTMGLIQWDRAGNALGDSFWKSLRNAATYTKGVMRTVAPDATTDRCRVPKIIYDIKLCRISDI